MYYVSLKKKTYYDYIASGRQYFRPSRVDLSQEEFITDKLPPVFVDDLMRKDLASGIIKTELGRHIGEITAIEYEIMWTLEIDESQQKEIIASRRDLDAAQQKYKDDKRAARIQDELTRQNEAAGLRAKSWWRRVFTRAW